MTRLAPLLAFLAWCGLFFLLIFPARVSAGSTGTLCITVRDSVTNGPISGARLFVVGSGQGQALTRETDTAGKACFENLGPYAFHVKATKAGYESASLSAEVFASSTTSLDIPLQTLRVIGSVRTTNPGTRVSVDSSNLATKVNPDFLASLNSIPGIRVFAGSSGLGAIGSINGADPAQTNYTINGVSVGDGAALSINTDLLSRADIDAQNDTIAYSFLGPTQEDSLHGQAESGGYGTSLIKGTAQGTAGDVGFAFAHSVRATQSALNGQIYQDQSGLTYDHVGASNITGNYGLVSVQTGGWNISLSDPISTTAKNPISAYEAGTTPAGFGPGEVISTVSSNPLLSINGALGDYALSLSAAGWDLREADDYNPRLVAGLPLPLDTLNTVSGSDIGFSITRASEHSEVGLTFDNKLSFYAFTATGAPDDSLSVPQQQWSASVARHLAHGLTLQSRATLTEASGRALPAVSATASWVRGSVQEQLSVNAGKHFTDAAALQSNLGLIDPTTAQTDCANHTISIEGPGDSSTEPTTIGALASLTRSYGRSSFSANAYYNRVTNAILSSAPVAISALPIGSIPADYIAALQATYTNVARCPGAAPLPASIFLVRNVGGIDVGYQGLTVQGTAPIGTRVILEANVAITAARLLDAPALLDYSLSPYLPGAQLPNVPLVQGSVISDWHAARRLELLSSLNWTAANNPDNLPSYMTANLGAFITLTPHASIRIIASNVTNSYTGSFVSPRYAVPLRTLGGEPFATLAAPLPSSALYVSLLLSNRDP